MIGLSSVGNIWHRILKVWCAHSWWNFHKISKNPQGERWQNFWGSYQCPEVNGKYFPWSLEMLNELKQPTQGDFYLSFKLSVSQCSSSLRSQKNIQGLKISSAKIPWNQKIKVRKPKLPQGKKRVKKKIWMKAQPTEVARMNQWSVKKIHSQSRVTKWGSLNISFY